MNRQETDLYLRLHDQLGGVSTQEYIDWATQRLSQGDKSAAVLRLACAYASDSRYEIRALYLQACRGLDFPDYSAQELLLAGACLVAQLYLSKELDAVHTVKMLYQIWLESDYTLPHLGWIDALDSVSTSPDESFYAYYSYPDFDPENWPEQLRQECDAFIKISAARVPECRDSNSICADCGQTLQLVPAQADGLWQKFKGLFHSGTEFPLCCSHCDSQHIIPYNSLAGRSTLAKFSSLAL